MGLDQSEEPWKLGGANADLREQDQLRATIEELLEAVRSAEESRDRYKDLYDHAPQAQVTVDVTGVVHELNLRAATLFSSAPRSSLVGERLGSFVVDEDQHRLVAHLRNCSTSHTSICSVRLKAPVGGSVPVQLSSRRGHTDAGLYPTAILDMGERQEAAQEMDRLRAAERKAREASDAKDQFIAVLSHELRTPLTPMLAAVSALVRRSDTPPVVRSLCETIHRNVVTEARLIDDLLDVTRIERRKVHLEPVLMDVHETARHALEVVADDLRSKELTVVVALEAERPWTVADPMRMRQVFWNLLRNAAKFSQAGGRIELRSWNRDDRLGVEIRDTGIGFKSEDMPRLFEAFAQDPDAARQHGGLGLGLAICKGLVELQGGTITATSRGLNQGARFVVEMTTATAPAGHGSPPPTGTAASARLPTLAVADKSRILLVEDDRDTSDMLRAILADAGHHVRAAGSMRAALAEELDGFDLLLCDIGLPDGSGLDLMRHIRDRSGVRGIALSGYGTEADKRASLQAGFSAHLTKPIDIDVFLRVIDEIGTGMCPRGATGAAVKT